MAPEQALGRTQEIDAQSDLWAVGATLFTLCSGEYVHVGSTGQEMLLNAATRPARSLAPLAPNIPAAMAAVIDRAISYDKRNRWPDAAAMRGALLEAMSVPVAARAPAVAAAQRTPTVPLPLPSHTPLSIAPPAPQPTASGSKVLPLMAAGLAIGVVIIVVQLVGERPAEPPEHTLQPAPAANSVAEPASPIQATSPGPGSGASRLTRSRAGSQCCRATSSRAARTASDPVPRRHPQRATFMSQFNPD